MKQTGFTLIELLVVVMIVAVLTSIAMPQYRTAMDRSKAAEATQMLPALFEARERWMIENQCRWSDAGACYNALTFGKLDIESTGAVGEDHVMRTPIFEYRLTDSTPTGVSQPCVTATARWGNGRVKGAKIYFRGDKFSCTDGTNAGACDILNVTPEGPAGQPNRYRTGCI